MGSSGILTDKQIRKENQIKRDVKIGEFISAMKIKLIKEYVVYKNCQLALKLSEILASDKKLGKYASKAMKRDENMCCEQMMNSFLLNRNLCIGFVQSGEEKIKQRSLGQACLSMMNEINTLKNEKQQRESANLALKA